MNYLNTADISKIWNISQRRVRLLCQNGQIPNCKLVGKTWLIPESAVKPEDKRTKSSKKTVDNLDYLHLLLNAEYASKNLNANNFEIEISNIQQTMLEGKLDEAFSMTDSFIKKCNNAGYLLVAVTLKFTLSFYMGKKDIQEELITKYKYLLEDERMKYLNMYIKMFLYNDFSNIDYTVPTYKIPQLFYRVKRNFLIEMIKKDIKVNDNYLELEMSLLENEENMEIIAYHHTLLASYYSFINRMDLHDLHVKKALDIILPRSWYLLIAEHVNINWHLETYLDEKKIKEIKKLQSLVCSNHIKRGTSGRVISGSKLDSVLIIKIMYQIATKQTNEDISSNLNISLYLVKKYVNEIYRLIGTDNRKSITKILLREMDFI